MRGKWVFPRARLPEDVEHAGDILDRGRWAQFVRHDMEYRERLAESSESVPGC